MKIKEQFGALKGTDNMAASSSSQPFPKPSNPGPQTDIIKEIHAHEVAIAELKSLSSSRSVYQRNGNIFFRTTSQKAMQTEQKQLDSAKVAMQRLSMQ